MRAVIYLVSGVLLSVVLVPAPLLDALRVAETPLAPPALQAPAALVGGHSAQEQHEAARQALMRGTNNVATDTLMRAALAPDALEKGADLDADGDPDVLHIRLEAVPAAPWTLQPKAFGPLSGLPPSGLDAQGRAHLPDLHLEAGDRVLLTLENAYSQALSLRFPGGAVLALTPAGLPVSQAPLVLPGASYTWLLHPLHSGTAEYAGHAAHSDDATPLGRVTVTANLPDNTLQSVATDLPVARPAMPVPEQSVAPSLAAASLEAGQLLQLSGFGLALGLALAGLLGLLLPALTARLQQGAPR